MLCSYCWNWLSSLHLLSRELIEGYFGREIKQLAYTRNNVYRAGAWINYLNYYTLLLYNIYC